MIRSLYFEGTEQCRVACIETGDLSAVREATRDMTNAKTPTVAVRVRNHLSAAEIKAALEGMQRIVRQKVDGISQANQLHTYGITQQRFWANAKQYADDAEAWRQDEAFMKIAGIDSDIIRKTMAVLSIAFEKQMEPAEQKGRLLLPATIRAIDYAAPHKDVVGGGTTGIGLWDVEQLKNDVAWNAYLQQPDTGGELTLFPKEAASCKKFNDLQRHDAIAVPCTPGDLVFFRSAVPHGVRNVTPSGSRITISGILAEEKNGETMRYWA